MDASCTLAARFLPILGQGSLLLGQSLFCAACTRIPNFCRVYWLGKGVRQDPAALLRPITMEMLLRLTNHQLKVQQETGPGLGSDPVLSCPLLVLHSTLDPAATHRPLLLVMILGPSEICEAHCCRDRCSFSSCVESGVAWTFCPPGHFLIPGLHLCVLDYHLPRFGIPA